MASLFILGLGQEDRRDLWGDFPKLGVPLKGVEGLGFRFKGFIGVM